MVIFHPHSFFLPSPPSITFPNRFSLHAIQKEIDSTQSLRNALVSLTLIGGKGVSTLSISGPIKDTTLIPNLSKSVAQLFRSATDEYGKLTKAIDSKEQEKNRFILRLNSDLEAEKRSRENIWKISMRLLPSIIVNW